MSTTQALFEGVMVTLAAVVALAVVTAVCAVLSYWADVFFAADVAWWLLKASTVVAITAAVAFLCCLPALP